MTKEKVNLYECEDLIQLQHLDTLMKKNTVKFHEYVNQHELLRIRFFLTGDVCKFLKTWIHTVYEDIISLKSQFGELGRLYEILLESNFIKEFLDYSNSQEILQLKLVETVIENKRMKANVDAANKEVASLKSEFECLTRTYEELSKNHYAKEFLNFVKPKETLRLKIGEKLDECQNLEICMDKACTKIVTLNSELDKSIRKYQTLSDNDNVKEFISQAKYQDELRLKSNENLRERVASLESQLKKTHELLDKERRDRRKIEKGNGSSKSSLNQSKKQTTSVELQLKKVRELLNKERCRRQKLEDDRDSSARLSEDLCRLLAKHLDCKLHEKTRERNIVGDQATPSTSNINVVAFNSSSNPRGSVLESKNINEINVDSTDDDNNTTPDHQISCSDIEMDCTEPVVVKKEKTEYESRIRLDAPVDKSNELSNPRINYNNSSVVKNDVIGLSTESSLESSAASSIQSAISNPDGRELRQNTKDTCSSIEISKKKLPKIKPRFVKLLPKKTIPTVSLIPPSNNIDEVSFRCDKCRKSFVVKPNERKPQQCPFCEMKFYKQPSNHRVTRTVSVLPVATSEIILKPESESSAVLENVAEKRKISS